MAPAWRARTKGNRPAVADDEGGDRIVTRGEVLDRNLLAGHHPAEKIVIAHEHALIDVVPGVDGGEGRRDRQLDAAPLLGLDRGLPRRAHALAVAGDDDLEAPVHERPGREEAPPIDDQAGVGVDRDLGGQVVEADPPRSHGIGVDVVEQIRDPDVVRPQVQLAAQLAADELRVLGQVEYALARLQRETGPSHLSTPSTLPTASRGRRSDLPKCPRWRRACRRGPPRS